MPRSIPHLLTRRHLLHMAGGTAMVAAVGALTGCGFKLRGAPNFAFSRIYLGFAPNSALGNEVRRNMASNASVQVLDATQQTTAQVILDVLGETREKVVVGLNASGQVREFQLRMRFRFRLRTPDGKDLIPDAEIVQQRDISFNESVVLSKEAEEALLYRDMQSDIVQQLMRRLSAVKEL